MKNNQKIYLSSPNIKGREISLVKQAMQKNWLSSMGVNYIKFEKKLSNLYRGCGVALTASGTAAIHLALVLLGVKKNDLVFCQSFTFAGSAFPIKYLDAEPVFIDSEKDTWNMDPDALVKALEFYKRRRKKPKAIVLVHLYGVPAKINEIIKIAKKYKVPIIEDAAEAFGSRVNGKLCGSFCEFGVLSFNVNKIITTAGGGALISKNKKLIDNAKFLASQAKDKHYHYQHSAIGFNYRMSNLSASIGLAQTERFKKIIQKHRANFNYYKKHLEDDVRFSFLEESKNKILLNRWITVLKFSSKFLKKYSLLQLIEIFRKSKVEVKPLWKPLHLQPVFKDCKYFGSNVSEKIFKSGMCLPSGSNLKNKDLKKVVYILKNLK